MTRVVAGDAALAEFRRHWNGGRLLQTVRDCGGRVLVDWRVGVGKSFAIDNTVEEAVRTGAYALIVVLLATRQVLDERRWIRNPPANVKIVNLRPRPREKCGPSRDTQWVEYEARDLGALGRRQICRACPSEGMCFWPRQYGKGLEGTQVIFGTQAHLERSPAFVEQLRRWTKATSMLLLLDEVNFLASSFRRRVRFRDLETFVDVLRTTKAGTLARLHRDWTYRAELLLRAGTDDLRAPDWRTPPVISSWAARVQKEGERRAAGQFRFLGYDLWQFGYSPRASRERCRNGDLVFATVPWFGCDLAVFSGTADSEFTKFRLGVDLASPFAEYRFEHPETCWYNIASNIATRGFFRRNSKQILDFFAALVLRRLEEGKRPLLVAKKVFAEECAAGIEDRLRASGFRGARVVRGDWDSHDLARPGTIPLITYGIVGTNLFEAFDCAYCLTGYYVTERVVDEILQDVLASDGKIPIRITSSGIPRRRSAGVKDRRDRFYDIDRLANLALHQQETDVVLQAVGRVRPYTRPREVITFQCAALPRGEYTREFCSLQEAREYFGIETDRARKTADLAARVGAARAGGLTQAETARKIGVTVRTVKRYWQSRRVT